jgi:hypothetical protein
MIQRRKNDKFDEKTKRQFNLFIAGAKAITQLIDHLLVFSWLDRKRW